MPGTAPPYALDTVTFPFPALATCAGRAQLGGDRELALSALMAAQLAYAMLPPIAMASQERVIRAERAKHWLGGFAMPQPARMAFLRAFDATTSAPAIAAQALAEVSQLLTGHIDEPSQQEIAILVAHLQAEPATEQPASDIYYQHTH